MEFQGSGLISEDSALFSLYNQVFSTKLKLVTVQEPLPLFIPRADYYLSLRCMVTGQPANEQALDQHFEAKLLKYAKVLSGRHMFWRYGRTVDLTTYMLFFPKQKLRYLWIPKTACTTIKAELLKRIDPEFLAAIPIGGFHETVNAKYRVSIDQLTNSDVQEIAFIRHPVERLVSCYFDKFAKPLIAKRRFEKFILRHIAQIYKLLNINAEPDKRSVSFAEFLFYILKQPSWSHDAHWRPQVDFLGSYSNRTLYRLDGIEQVLRDVGLPAETPIEKRNRSAEAGFSESEQMSGRLFEQTPDQISTADIKSYNEFLSPSTYNQLRAWLKEDFDQFENAR